MKKILVIEDDPEVRDNIADILELTDDFAFEVATAENGQVGLSCVTEMQPDLIICDVMMPGLNGYEVLNALREKDDTRNIPLIFLTAKVDRDDQRTGMELGADDYLTKPFTARELLSAIAARLAKQDAAEQRMMSHLNHLRSSITLSLPHELYTPLNGILAFSEFFLTNYDSIEPDEGKEILESIHTSGKRLQHLVQNFLLYAQLETMASDPHRLQKIRSDRVSTPISALIRDIAYPLAERCNRTHDLKLDLQETLVMVSDSMMHKTLEELIDNAFKFSEKNTIVAITCQLHNQVLTVTITNSGRGMTADQIAYLGAYSQIERCLHEQQGSGMGLAIAKRMVELQEGSLTIISHPDRETCITVELPVGEPQESEELSEI